MNKVFYTQVGGLYYPLVFSLGAKRRMAEIQKALAPLQKSIKRKKQNISDEEKILLFGEAIESIATIGEILIQQGVCWNNSFKGTGRIRSNSAVDENGKWRSITSEEILLFLKDDEVEKFTSIIMACLSSGTGDIKVKLSNPKNQKK